MVVIRRWSSGYGDVQPVIDARSRNRAVASLWSASDTVAAFERHAGTGNTYSKGTRSRARLVASTTTRGQAGQQSLDQGADPFEQVLAVVQHQEHVGAGELGEHRVRGRPPRLLPEPEGARQRSAHHRRVRDRHEVDVVGTARMTAADVLGDGQGQPGLAHAPRADGGDQPVLGKGTRERRPLGRPAHERGQRCRQAATACSAASGGAASARSPASSANARRSATAELAQQRRDVALDGANGEVQPGGDLLVGQVLPDQREHLGLSLGDAGVGERR